MKAKDLKNSILQMAVEGKLVPQDPTDEPASVLLERIREEKHKLIAEGKAKFPKGGESVIYIGSDGSPYEKHIDAKGRVLSDKCIADEVPFGIPEGWSWTRLETLTSVITDGDHQAPPQQMSGVPFLVISNVSSGVLDFRSTRFVSNAYYEALDDSRKPRLGDLLLTVTGSFGIPVKVDTHRPFCFQRHISLLRQITRLDYVEVAISAPATYEYFKLKATGTAQKTVPLSAIRSALVPLPPLAEQLRIVERVNGLMPLVEEYGKLEDAREELDTALPGRLRKSVLQEAVRGRLVPQDPADEPADILLERIRGQRRQLVAEKKMKAPKGGESVIFTGSDGRRYEKRVDSKGRESEPVCIEDEIPFDIPESWEWARFTEVVPVQYGFAADSSKFTDGKAIGLIRIRDVNSGDLNHTSVNYRGKYDKEYVVRKGDDLIGMDGEFLCRRWSGPNALLNQRVCCLRFYPNSVDPDFVSYVINWYLSEIWKQTSKTTVKHLSAKALNTLLIAVPPVSEQKRIADRLRELVHLKS